MQVPSLVEILAREAVLLGALRLGSFKLSSGTVSPVYLDARSLLQSPRAYRLVAAGLTELMYRMEDKYGGFDAIVGVATGGVPWATMLAYVSGKPLGYARPRRKQHGLGRTVEGARTGRVLLVDDVATTGGSLAAAAEAVREHGGRPVAAAVIVDREQGARELLAEHGVKLHSLTTLRSLLQAAAGMGLLDRREVERVISTLYGGRLEES